MFAKRVSLLLVLGATVVLWAGSGVASASVPAPGWEIFTRTAPTNLPPGGTGEVDLYVYNTGAGTGEYPTVTDELPEGVTATGAGLRVVVPIGGAEEAGDGPGSSFGECTVESARMVSCTDGSVPPGAVMEVKISASIEDVPSGSEGSNVVEVSGGGAPNAASNVKSVRFDSASPGFGFAGFDAWFTNADGTTDTQAGSHPYAFTTVFAANSTGVGGLEEFTSGSESVRYGGEMRDVVVNLPPGIVGNATAVPRCSRKQFDGETATGSGTTGSGGGAGYQPSCPASTQVGIDQARPNGYPVSFKVYNLVPSPGIPAEFGLDFEGAQVFIDIGVRSGGPGALASDYGLSGHIDPFPQKGVVFNTITIWGEPGEASHEEQRGGLPSGAGSTPLLTVPTSCEGPQEISIEALGTWQNENARSRASILTHDSTGTPVGFTGCDHLGFGPSLSVAPDTTAADTPAGLTTEIKVPQEGLSSSGGLAASNVRNGTVVLPEGTVLNPGRAAGLATCPLDQDGVDQEGPPQCPPASQVGTATVLTPLLAEPLEGKVYVLESDPPDVKLLIALAGQGVEVKLVGDVHLNTSTGQLTTVFKETPEVPFTNFKLAFSGGSQAALVTPPTCGLFTSASDFTPWSSPAVEDVFSPSSFQIATGTNGVLCASPLPFTPSMIAGATTDQAGGYTAFSLLLSRADDQQRISKLQFKTPKGLLGMISHVQLCEEPQAAKGECPSGSQIGHTVVGAGAGPDPLYVPEEGKPEAPIYITGPYEGAPYGLAIAVPVIAGPFNLGTTVVRGRIEVDPQTSQLTITTDPLPTILDGVPVDMRTIDAVIDRKEFMFNPTNCNPQSFSGTATSVEGTNAALSSPFQVGSCRSLTFKPGFKVATSAKTSRTEGASLHVTMTLPDEGGLSSTANVQRVKVSLPKQLPTPLKTLQKACLEKTFAENPKNCPVASQVGTVKVSTPVLPGGLTGTAYFVSHGGAKYPELIMVLVGQNGVTVQVHGKTEISKAGITTATFATVPDVPFSNFELTLPQREFPALTANGNLCKGTLLMPTELVGQNGLVIQQSTKIAVTGCPKAKKAAKKKAHRKAAKGRRKKK